MFINTQVFREPAIHFKKYKRYEDGDYGSLECMDYWERETNRVNNGYEVGGIRITGKHYLYLNYLPILRTIESEDLNQKLFKTKKKKARRDSDFVDFWDEDYILFHTWDIAREGVAGNTFEEQLINLKKISKHLTIPIVESEDNLSGGKNHLWLKPRGVGASWKGAVIPIYNQFFINNSTTFMVANEEKYLTDDGIYTKYLEYKNTLLGRHDNWRDLGLTEKSNFRCAGFRRTFSKQDIGGMHFRASRMESVEDGGVKQLVEVGGKKSSVYGLPINGNPNNIRGKRGHIIYEEFGTFPRVKDTWEVAQQGVEQDGAVFATQYGFGTGGDENNISIADLTLMFNDPTTYNILEFTNIYDKELYGLKSAYFTTCLQSLNFIDKNGNTDQVASEAYFDEEREKKSKGADPTALVKYCAEKPKSPSEALMGVKGNIFPVQEIKAHKTRLLASKLHRELIVTGRLEPTIDGTIKFNKTGEVPYEDYPAKPNSIIDSPICIINPPYNRGIGVPKHMYRITVDPYRNDSSTGDSIGSVWVVENPNNLTAYKGDKIVAWYHARPRDQADFNKNLFYLAKYYNCKIAPENDEPGGIIDYAKVNKLLYLLEEEFELAYDERIKTKSTSKKSYGMHIASGKDDLRKLQGDKYIQEWLWRPRGMSEEGPILNLHYIYDIGFLEELIQYGQGKNADRISSFRINMYYEREFLYKGKTINTQVKQRDTFFTMNLFN